MPRDGSTVPTQNFVLWQPFLPKPEILLQLYRFRKTFSPPLSLILILANIISHIDSFPEQKEDLIIIRVFPRKGRRTAFFSSNMIQRPTKVFPFSSGTKPKKRRRLGQRRRGKKFRRSFRQFLSRASRSKNAKKNLKLLMFAIVSRLIFLQVSCHYSFVQKLVRCSSSFSLFYSIFFLRGKPIE